MNMKRLITVLMLSLLPCMSAWARLSVTHISPTNSTDHKLVFTVHQTVESNSFSFAVTVSGTTNNPLPQTYSADVVTSGGISQKMEHTEPHEKDGITEITYRFAIPADQLADATFCFRIPPPPNSPQAYLGGYYYALDLKPFTEETHKDSNQPSDRMR